MAYGFVALTKDTKVRISLIIEQSSLDILSNSMGHIVFHSNGRLRIKGNFPIYAETLKINNACSIEKKERIQDSVTDKKYIENQVCITRLRNDNGTFIFVFVELNYFQKSISCTFVPSSAKAGTFSCRERFPPVDT